MLIPSIKKYECPKCEAVGHCSRFGWDPYEGVYVCEDCGEVCTLHSETKAEWFSVAIYEVDNAYGGPEEGGWYYSRGSRVDRTIRNFPNTAEGKEEAEKYVQSLLSNEYVYDIRVQSTRYTYKVGTNELAPKSFPRHAPVYC